MMFGPGRSLHINVPEWLAILESPKIFQVTGCEGTYMFVARNGGEISLFAVILALNLCGFKLKHEH
jgi:hypothetical protein